MLITLTIPKHQPAATNVQKYFLNGPQEDGISQFFKSSCGQLERGERHCHLSAIASRAPLPFERHWPPLPY